MDKRDVYRLFRVISGIRKGEYWRSIDALDRVEDSLRLNRFLQSFMELQDESNSALEVFIFFTTILLALLQLLQSIFGELTLLAIVVSLVIYLIILTISTLNHRRRKSEINLNLTKIEGDIRARIYAQRAELEAAGLKDDLISYMTELRLLEELEIAYEKKVAESGTDSEIKEELDNLKNAKDGLLEAIRRKQAELETVKKKKI